MQWLAQVDIGLITFNDSNLGRDKIMFDVAIAAVLGGLLGSA